ncbi:hypothetical protein FOL47_009319, partial [Perkinsus chesapeaki]
MSSFLTKCGLCGLLVSLIIGLFGFLSGDIVLTDVTGPVPVLGEGGYDVQDLVVPTATGTKLQILAWILGQWRGGRVIRRALLNGNHPESLRQLALQVDKRIPSLTMPIQRLSDEDFEKAKKYAAEERGELRQ